MEDEAPLRLRRARGGTAHAEHRVCECSVRRAASLVGSWIFSVSAVGFFHVLRVRLRSWIFHFFAEGHGPLVSPLD